MRDWPSVIDGTNRFKQNPLLDSNMPNALVTGAAGFIGSHLVDGLLDRGYCVTGLDNFTTGSIENLEAAKQNNQFTLIEGDIRDKKDVDAAMEDIDAVFHLAAYTSVPGSFERPAYVSAVNCTGTATVLSTALEADVESVVLASSAAIYGSEAPTPVDESAVPNPESPYASSKLYTEQLGEQLSSEFGMDVVSLRFFNVYGPRQDPEGEYAAVVAKFIQLMNEGKRPIIFGDGKQTRDFVYVEDVVQANVAAAESDHSGIYNVGRGKRVSILELVERVNDVLDVEYAPIYQDPRPGDIRHSGADISKMRSQFGVESNVELEAGLRETARYFN